ncbi:ATP synthase subunit gamma, mitochondrial [Hypsibius exemplaris]|uniref:ATP synthase F(1) complex subunit gamma, mitochondrial n=1 Tax=Hypsibius exemplaris TaxID=2072580 RepID=A0A1W0X6F6_HYPEX|nr:ATP synthase subunit gamma, mitochondrial [Hypsibius exemplaris]
MFSGKIVLFVPTSTCGQVRSMATLKDISLRLKSIKNIQKITKSMKMVSAAKYARAERELKPARPYGAGAMAFYEKAEIKGDPAKPNHLIVAISSDRGLCGGIHSGIVKAIRLDLAEKKNVENVKIVAVGDKARGILQRQFRDNILLSAKELGRKPPTFGDASEVAQAILNAGYEFDSGSLYYNQFRSVVSYKPTIKPIFSLDAILRSDKINLYDDIDSEVLRSYMEYNLASLVYFAMKENAASEQSSRMTAMDNASKNAGEIIQKLTLTFNRTRQAVITRELIEIISGASAL